MSAHTPGPWGVSSSFLVCNMDARIIANCAFLGLEVLDVAFEERIANAHLIAAAPDLYEALKRLVALLNDDLDDQQAEAWDAACAALAKAEGQ